MFETWSCKITKKGTLNSQVIKFTSCIAHGRWFSPGTSASSSTKTGRHDIAGILLKVVLSTNINLVQYNHQSPVLS